MTIHSHICKFLITVLFAVVLFGASISHVAAGAGTEPLMNGSVRFVVETGFDVIARGTEPLMGGKHTA